MAGQSGLAPRPSGKDGATLPPEPSPGTLAAAALGRPQPGQQPNGFCPLPFKPPPHTPLGLPLAHRGGGVLRGGMGGNEGEGAAWPP